MTPHRNILGLLAAACLLAPALAHAQGADKTQKGTYIEVTGLAATIVRAEGGHGVMTVEAGLDVPDPRLHAFTLLQMPRLQDAFTQALQAYGGGLRPGTPPDADYVARQLQSAADHILGKPGARLLLCGLMVN